MTARLHHRRNAAAPARSGRLAPAGDGRDLAVTISNAARSRRRNVREYALAAPERPRKMAWTGCIWSPRPDPAAIPAPGAMNRTPARLTPQRGFPE